MFLNLIPPVTLIGQVDDDSTERPALGQTAVQGGGRSPASMAAIYAEMDKLILVIAIQREGRALSILSMNEFSSLVVALNYTG